MEKNIETKNHHPGLLIHSRDADARKEKDSEHFSDSPEQKNRAKNVPKKKRGVG